jgi:D-threonate/D-erythronate kinase
VRKRERIGLIADDLTGTLDTGVQFRLKGLVTVVPFKFSPSLEDIPVLALNSNSRHSSPEAAYRKVRQLCKKLKGRILYKKIDSTLRGNVGAETLAMLDESGFSKAILAPAFPTQGRTLEGGILKFYGTPFHLTHYRDEFSPALDTSFVPDLLMRGIGEPIGRIGRKELNRGPSALAKKILEAKERIILIDTCGPQDLRIIGQAWWGFLKEKALICGSAGLAKELEIAGSRKLKDGIRIKRVKRPLLLVSGSRHQKTLEQVRRAIDAFRLPMVEPDIETFADPARCSREIRRVAGELCRILESPGGAVLSTSFQKAIPGREERISVHLGRVVSAVLRRRKLSSLILSGGDIAVEACGHLKSTAMRIETEILQGIPLSSLTDGPYKGLNIVTKGGGLGDPDAFIEVIRYLTKEGE